MNRTACIFTEAGNSIGFGHLTRCLSFAEAFREYGIDSMFIIESDIDCTYLIKDYTYKMGNWLTKRHLVSEAINNADIAVVDSYIAEKKIYDYISLNVDFPIFIDDSNRIEYPPGFVVNGALYAQNILYPINKGVTYLLGPEYQPFRKAFWNVATYAIKKKIETLLITIGGSDVLNLLPGLITAVHKKFPEIKKNIVLGSADKKKYNTIEQIAKVSNGNIYVGIDEDNICTLMQKADVAISAAGQTLYELARIGVPTVAICVVNNQYNNYIEWKKNGYIETAGTWDDGSDEIILEVIRKLILLNDFFEREKRSKIGKNIAGGDIWFTKESFFRKFEK